MTASPDTLVDLADLTIRFAANAAAGNATVDRIDLRLGRGEFVALVGESGSGKSLIAHALAGILNPAARLESRRFDFAGIDLSAPGGSGWRDVRGREIGIVFQNPRSALNPVRKVGRQIEDVIAEHRLLRGVALRTAAIEALSAVRIPDPERRFHAYPHELSGGMCQRVMVAIALAGDPVLLVADEPTTGLDTTTQAAVLDLVRRQARARGMACLLITHDLSLARQHADRILVMHAGQIVEDAAAERLFTAPAHPYTRALIAATPAEAAAVADLAGIPGGIPDLRGAVPACRYADRCDRALGRCRTDRPPLDGPAGARVACWNALP